MSITAVEKDLAARTLTITAEFDASPERVWRLWDDPRRLERWWGPPAHPATVTEHDLRPGGRVAFFVTAAGGERLEGRWSVHAVDPPSGLAFKLHNPGFPAVEVRVEIAELGEGRTRMTTAISFGSDAAMDELLAIGFDRGMRTAVEQAESALED